VKRTKLLIMIFFQAPISSSLLGPSNMKHPQSRREIHNDIFVGILEVKRELGR